MYKLLVAACYLLVSCILFSCSTTSSNEQTSKKPNSSVKVIPNEFADGFIISQGENFELLQILSPFQDSADTLSYIIVEKGVEVPRAYKDYQKIYKPINKLTLTSTTHIAMVEALEKVDNISGITDPSFVFSETIKKNVEDKKIQVAGQNGQLNLEIILASGTDVVISGAWSTAAYNAYTPLLNANIPVLINAEWTEAHPLGRLEWIKIFGLLLGETQKANSIFEKRKSNYLALASKVQEANLERPSVINGMPYQEAWSIAGGNSYVGTLLKDAGSYWHWENDTSAVSLQLDFETVYEVGEQASIWLSPGRAFSMDEILAIDSRFKNFSSFKNQEVYNYHNRVNEAGMYDYYESGVVQPDIILADLIKIFHPSLFAEHSLYYYKKVE